MRLCRWEELPEEMRTPEVREYYDLLVRKRASLAAKRAFDVMASATALALISPLMVGLGIAIKKDSEGPVFFRQTRITQYGKEFKIHKFRTMVDKADEKGPLVTVGGDSRITKIGKLLRDNRLDELPQLIDILEGTMTFVGTRPEVKKYVDKYTPEMMATLLLPAGVTSLASVYYADEARLLDAAENPDDTYINEILPEKMKWNLKGIKEFTLIGEFKIMLMTVLVALGVRFEEK